MPLAKLIAAFTLVSCSLMATAALAEPAVSPVVSAGTGASPQQRAPDLEKARVHFGQGVQFYNAGDYKLSLLEFRRSYELSKNYRILYNIGQVNQQLGNYTNALLALEQYLRDGGGELGEERKVEATASIQVLRTRVAHIRILSNVAAPEVLVDGFPVQAKDSNADIVLDPGDHRVDLRKPGYQNGGTVISLAAGDVNKVRVDLVRVPSAIRVAAPLAAAPSRRNSTWMWVGWSTTAATAMGAGITGILAVMQANELANLRNSSSSTQAQRDEVGTRARAFSIASDVLTGTAVAAGSLSLYLTLRSDKVEPEHRPVPSTRVSFTGNGLRLEQAF